MALVSENKPREGSGIFKKVKESQRTVSIRAGCLTNIPFHLELTLKLKPAPE